MGENIDFDGWLFASDGVLIEFAGNVVGVREALRMSGNRSTDFFASAEALWEQLQAELERRGLLESFKSERGMD